ncbi:MAG TPA: hypothetical protein VG848_11110 [Acetobacteraceae bacterium]|nr:hypothetical protein [Acetobacteraceae bacterium]
MAADEITEGLNHAGKPDSAASLTLGNQQNPFAMRPKLPVTAFLVPTGFHQRRPVPEAFPRIDS